MALVKCPECSKKVSEKAETCPNCAYPIRNDFALKLQNINKSVEAPELPDDLSIGKVVNLFIWPIQYNDIDAQLLGEQTQEEFMELDFPVKITFHKHGIRINKNDWPVKDEIIQLHFRQVIEMQKISSDELRNKDVIGPAVLGGLMLGPLGAIVGGMSGVGAKEKVFYLSITYWDREKKGAHTLFLSGLKNPIEILVSHLKENNSPTTQT